MVGARTRLLAAGLPPVEELLDVDREYREKAAAGTLRTIAPRRFNPRREAWLPVLLQYRAWPSPLYRAVFQHRSGPSDGEHAGLGSAVLR
jgi:hypothetical protein